MSEYTVPLCLLIQKGNATLYYTELARSKMISRKEECEWLTLKKISKLKNLAEEEILSLPVSERVSHKN